MDSDVPFPHTTNWKELIFNPTLPKDVDENRSIIKRGNPRMK